MDTYNLIQDELLRINSNVLKIFKDGESIKGVSDSSFGDWQKTCDGINRQMWEEVVRVAVVGPIKSGKSTFINALFQGEYLKRGAGVVTSIVTRVRSGKNLKAKLVFKTWDEVNGDIEQALVLFPSFYRVTDNEKFDIRRKKDRMNLERALASLKSEQLITNDLRNVNSVLLTSYLGGYDKIEKMISSDTMTGKYEDELFSRHWDFVSDGNMAVYLKDVQLEIDSKNIEHNIEIADCQGSDSPNPLHLAMIQDYLLLTHLIIYVISSRTGLREADIKFLSMIKKMGIMDNMMFVINCDFSEHDTLYDLEKLIRKVEEELALIKPEPEIYSFSALYHLFKTRDDKLSQKDLLRIKQWEMEKELLCMSNDERERFKESFKHKLTKERYTLLLKNHLERLTVISSGLYQWIFVNQNILEKDSYNADEIMGKIKSQQQRMNQLKAVIKSTLDGAIQKLKNEFKTEIDACFDVRSGDILKNVIKFIRDYQVSDNRYEKTLKTSGFSNTLYMLFAEFKQSLDTFIAESINPEIIRFIRGQESRIKTHLESIAASFDDMLQDAVVEYNGIMGSFGIERIFVSKNKIKLPSIDSIKDIAGLSIPPVVMAMRYSAKIKAEAAMRLGFYTLVKIFKKILQKPLRSKNEQELFALRDGVLRMKRETERSIIFHFKDYRENLKFQYIFRLVEAISNSLYEALLDRFQIYVTDFSSMAGLIRDERTEKEKAVGVLKDMEKASKGIIKRIDQVREKIETIAQS